MRGWSASRMPYCPLLSGNHPGHADDQFFFFCRHPLKFSLSFSFFGNPYILLGLATELGVTLANTYTQAGAFISGCLRKRAKPK